VDGELLRCDAASSAFGAVIRWVLFVRLLLVGLALLQCQGQPSGRTLTGNAVKVAEEPGSASFNLRWACRSNSNLQLPFLRLSRILPLSCSQSATAQSNTTRSLASTAL
jgi:hypothetical protein